MESLRALIATSNLNSNPAWNVIDVLSMLRVIHIHVLNAMLAVLIKEHWPDTCTLIQVLNQEFVISHILDDVLPYVNLSCALQV